MLHQFFRTPYAATVFILYLLIAVSPSLAETDPRPTLEVHQGRYFRYAMPEGWTAQETQNGVDMVSPDGYTGASFSLLVGGFAQQMTPRLYLQTMLQQMGYSDTTIHAVKDLPPQPAFAGFFWNSIVADLDFTYRGQPVRAQVTTSVIQGMGQYSAVLRGHQAPLAQWSRYRYWLPSVELSVVITDPYNVAGLSRISLPRNISHDEIYGEYNRAWADRSHTQDRMAQARHEGTMGYERMKDPATGQLYDMPLERYDPTRGGYVNPQRPTEILIPAEPGE